MNLAQLANLGEFVGGVGLGGSGAGRFGSCPADGYRSERRRLSIGVTTGDDPA